MIKNLLKADEEMPPVKKRRVKKTVVNPPENEEVSASLTTQETSENFETQQSFEIPEDAGFFAEPLESIDETTQVSEILEPKLEPLIEILESHPEPLIETANEEFVNLESPEIENNNPFYIKGFEDGKLYDEPPVTMFQSAYKPELPAETIRQSGLAYSAAIILFGSVVFMLILGWFADLLLGSSPWGIVGGIILGAIIGFVQFFRITSQIFKK